MCIPAGGHRGAPVWIFSSANRIGHVQCTRQLGCAPGGPCLLLRKQLAMVRTCKGQAQRIWEMLHPTQALGLGKGCVWVGPPVSEDPWAPDYTVPGYSGFGPRCSGYGPQHRHPLEAGWKCSLSRSIPDPPNQSAFNRGFMCTLRLSSTGSTVML